MRCGNNEPLICIGPHDVRMAGRQSVTAREKNTVETMVGMYCRGVHGRRDGLCPECSGLLVYAFGRIDSCPLREDKVRCSKCRIHCYRPDMRERIRTVMRYSGPRMLTHPVMVRRHLLS